MAKFVKQPEIAETLFTIFTVENEKLSIFKKMVNGNSFNDLINNAKNVIETIVPGDIRIILDINDEIVYMKDYKIDFDAYKQYYSLGFAKH